MSFVEGRHFGGWRPELPIPVSHKRSFSFAIAPAQFPPAFNLSLFDQIPVFDQLQHGTCGSNMGAAAFAFQEMKAGRPFTERSRRFLHAMVNHLEGVPLSGDTGVQIVDVFRALLQFGIPAEALCPYSPDPGPFTHEPSDEAKVDALRHESVLDWACPSVETIKAALLVGGSPVGFGFTVFESFDSQDVAETGRVPYPGSGEKVKGGHANLYRGWRDDIVVGGDIGAFRSRNSYGPGFGDAGDLWIPYRYHREGLATDARALADVAP